MGTKKHLAVNEVLILSTEREGYQLALVMPGILP